MKPSRDLKRNIVRVIWILLFLILTISSVSSKAVPAERIGLITYVITRNNSADYFVITSTNVRELAVISASADIFKQRNLYLETENQRLEDAQGYEKYYFIGGFALALIIRR